MLEYRGLHGTLERMIVPEEQVDRQIDRLLEQHPQILPVTGRASRLGDELVLDYAGFADGVQFEGGTAEGQTLVLGSGTFIPGFEEQLVGKNVGDEVDVRVTFPAQYHAPALAGKEAVFRCRIHGIRVRQKRTPDDAFAREVAGVESLAALRGQMRERMQAYADRQAEEDLMSRLLDRIVEGDRGAIAEEELQGAVEQQLQALEVQLQGQGLTLDAYCQFTGKTPAQLREECRPDAEKGIRRQRAVAEIAEAEGIEADEASVAAAIQELCRQNGMTVEQIAPYIDEAAQRAIVQNVITDKVLRCIRDSAVIETVTRQG